MLALHLSVVASIIPEEEEDFSIYTGSLCDPELGKQIVDLAHVESLHGWSSLLLFRLLLTCDESNNRQGGGRMEDTYLRDDWTGAQCPALAQACILERFGSCSPAFCHSNCITGILFCIVQEVYNRLIWPLYITISEKTGNISICHVCLPTLTHAHYIKTHYDDVWCDFVFFARDYVPANRLYRGK